MERPREIEAVFVFGQELATEAQRTQSKAQCQHAGSFGQAEKAAGWKDGHGMPCPYEEGEDDNVFACGKDIRAGRGESHKTEALSASEVL
jgi:hypothetical protein